VSGERDERARLRIDLAQRSIEIEGREAFVESFGERIECLLERLLAITAEPPPPLEEAPIRAERPVPAEAEPPQAPLEPFGAFLHRLPNAATEVDRMLAAGYHLERQTADGTFATADANKLLAEHGIKIGNPSQCVRQSAMAKRVFTFTRGRYKVSQEGRRHLDRLLDGGLAGRGRIGS